MLKIGFAAQAPKKEGVIGLFVPEKDLLTSEVKSWDTRVEGALLPAIRCAQLFKGEAGQTLALNAVMKNAPVRILLVGIGKPSSFDASAARLVGAKCAMALEEMGASDAFLHVSSIQNIKMTEADMAAHIAQGAQLRLYRFEKYKTAKKNETPRLEKLTFVVSDDSKAKRLFSPLQKINEAVELTRNLACEPANVLYPDSFAKEARSLQKMGIHVQVLGKTQMEKLGMGSLLSVSQGSEKEPRLVIMTWHGAPKGAKDKRPVALIGKGVTFDSGGISLKPGAGMSDMKYDMYGAAAVTGAMKALAGRKAKANVVGLIGLVENMPSGTATRPGDIVTSASGKTIEILNTDAEGRRVLADVVWYAQKYMKPRCLVDLATLTGAMPVALGQEYAGLFSNADKLADSLTKAGETAGELLWRMPLCKNFNKLLDSKIADMKDIGGRYAGSATGAHFIGRFVDDGMDWAHIDIAGVAYDNKDHVFAPQGPTGFGVRLLDQFVATYAES